MGYVLTDDALAPAPTPTPAPDPAPAPLVVSPFLAADVGSAWVSPWQVAWILRFAGALPAPAC